MRWRHTTRRTVGMIVLAAAFWALTSGTPADAAKSPPKTSDLGNLGDDLLDGVLEGLPAPPVGRDAPPAGAGRPPDAPQDDWLPSRERLRQSVDGEDVGARGQSPLAPVVDGMRRAESKLGGAETLPEAQPAQRDVVAALDKLIAEMEKQCQGGSQGQKPKPNQQQASQRSQPKPSAGSRPSQGAQAASSAAQTSTDRLGSAAPVAPATTAPPADLMKAAWGHLPERVRERMLQGSSDEFLPEYRDELEAYFRRLAEREAQESER